MKINGQELDYGKGMIGISTSEWSTGPTIRPYYAAHISGEPIDRPLQEMTEANIDLTLTVAVTREDGTVVEKEISAHFEPRKRSYFFAV